MVTVQANQGVLPRPGWRHLARLVERCAGEDGVELPAGPSQLDPRTWQWWVRRIPAPDAPAGSGTARRLLARRRPETSTAGTGTSPCPSWPPRSWLSRPPPNAATRKPFRPTQWNRSDPTVPGELIPIKPHRLRGRPPPHPDGSSAIA
ncbi:hypothetical protein OG331_04665 [Streptomyces sp. NBC_01017]|uniref:hypothetical protein n=1 Tax=Streptomyces sp. NBC_01017 TaxID=2903721 RepID=UPI0038674CBD|nr:hypothetical protein OG331_04665 [Streptomyces sp. NBC_01017]